MGETPVFYAVKGMRKDVVEEIVKCEYLDLNLLDQEGNTAISYASKLEQPEIALLLEGLFPSSFPSSPFLVLFHLVPS